MNISLLRKSGFLLLTALAFLPSDLPAAEPQGKTSDRLVYIGTYTGTRSKGIYAFRLDAKSGALKPLGLAAETSSPSFLALHPNGRFLYAVNEVSTFNGVKSGAVTAYQITPETGKLVQLNQQPSKGDGPCHLELDRTGRTLVVANYGGGSTTAYQVGQDGKLSEPSSFIQHTGSSVDPQRQKEPHAHCVTFTPDASVALICDLGLDKVLAYQLASPQSTLSPFVIPFTSLQPGSGPRHLAFSPSGKFAYVINEMASTLTTFRYSGQGDLKEVQTLSTLPEGFKGNSSTAEVKVHPSNRFVYGSNRGHDSIAVFSADAQTGKLTLVQHQATGGKVPRGFEIDPSGQFLLAANQESDNVVVFRIDATTGRLTATGESVEVGKPVCVTILP